MSYPPMRTRLAVIGEPIPPTKGKKVFGNNAKLSVISPTRVEVSTNRSSCRNYMMSYIANSLHWFFSEYPDRDLTTIGIRAKMLINDESISRHDESWQANMWRITMGPHYKRQNPFASPYLLRHFMSLLGYRTRNGTVTGVEPWESTRFLVSMSEPKFHTQLMKAYADGAPINPSIREAWAIDLNLATTYGYMSIDKMMTQQPKLIKNSMWPQPNLTGIIRAFPPRGVFEI